MPDYTHFDAELLKAIKGGTSKFVSLAVRLGSQAKTFCPTEKDEPFRVVDRRLQALRKKNLVAFNSKTGWTVCDAQK